MEQDRGGRNQASRELSVDQKIAQGAHLNRTERQSLTNKQQEAWREAKNARKALKNAATPDSFALKKKRKTPKIVKKTTTR
jgi:hypothetical protein